MDFLYEWAIAWKRVFGRESGLGLVGAMDEERATTGRPYTERANILR